MRVVVVAWVIICQTGLCKKWLLPPTSPWKEDETQFPMTLATGRRLN